MGTFSDDSPATYRFQPALRQEAARQVEAALKQQSQQKGYADLWGRGFGQRRA